MTDTQRQEIYNKWCKYQKKNNFPIPEYLYQAYSEKTYKLWESILHS